MLYTRENRSPEGTLLFRLALVMAMLASVVLVFWLDRDGLVDELDGEVSFGDVIYFTMVTITTVGYGDIVPVTQTARLIDALFVTPIRVFIWFVFLGTAYEFVIQKFREDIRMARIQARLKDHLVICGFGHCGRHAAREMVAKGARPEEIVVIDPSEDAIREAAAAGLVGLRGDATHDSVAGSAGVDRATAVIISTGRDDTNILIVLTVRNLSPKVRIVCSVREDENAKLVKQSGADVIVAPGTVGGYLLADAVLSPRGVEYIVDLMTARGEVGFNQRPAAAAEVGLPVRALPGALVVRIVRGDRQIAFWDCLEERIQPGDQLLLIERTEKVQA